MQPRRHENTKKILLSCFCVFVACFWWAALPRSAAAAPLAEKSFSLDSPAEVVATLHARCEGCDWGVAGREGAEIAIAVDGQYRAHVMLTRGDADAEYRVMLGRYAKGAHAIAVTGDPSAAAAGVKVVQVSRVD